MTVSEFMFLAFGLVLGVASGAALVEVLRARPPARREVRLTVAQDAIPRRRATTLADDAFVAVGPEPARGGPADRRGEDGPAPVRDPERRTNVRSGSPAMAIAAAGVAASPQGRVSRRSVGMPISSGADPMLGALQAGGGSPSRPRATRPGSVSNEASARSQRGASSTAVGLLDPPAEPATAAVSTPTTTPTYTGPCADERRLADERCELATRAQARSVAAADALRGAQRAFDSHTAAAETAAEAANSRAVRTRKEDAQRAFRAASRAAGSPDAVEAAARTWLQDINRINREAAAASLTADRERELAADFGARLERLGQAADMARVGADMAAAACVAARSAVADCDELAAGGSVAPRATPASEPESSAARDDEALGVALTGGTAPRVFRLLRGDPEAMDSLVASLGGDDPDEQARWKLAMAGLVDAVLADSIEQAYLRFPHEHPFWGPYTLDQNRDITRALASLGYRPDGLGGWVDDRMPAQRELSLALGYAGLDPMRMRQWPNEQQTARLFREVDVAADEYLADVAGNLTLAEMVEMLGRRADGLVDLWNHWGRIRPLLLEES